MTRWTRERERIALVEHVSRCQFCRALLAHGGRRDIELLTTAEALAREHTDNDAAREAFSLRALDERARPRLPRGPL